MGQMKISEMPLAQQVNKTDYVPNGDVRKLEEKYNVQLEIYKKALENATGLKVDKAMIWALNLTA